MNRDMKKKLAELRRLDPVDEAHVHRAETAAPPLMQAILAGDRVPAEAPAPAHRQRRGHRRPRHAASPARRLVPAAIVAALAVALIATAPGQAVAGWVGARLGI